MGTRPEGALSSVLSRDIPDRAGTGRIEKKARPASRLGLSLYPCLFLVGTRAAIASDFARLILREGCFIIWKRLPSYWNC